MTSSIKQPTCAYCRRGTKIDPSGGYETFILVQAEIKRNGRYEGRKYHVFCGRCVKLIAKNEKIDFANLTIPKSIQIVIEHNKKYLEILN